MNFNKSILGGRLTADPTTKTLTNGTTVTHFTVAVDRTFAKGETKVDFFDCNAFGAKADVIAKYFKKGNNILVTGTLETRSFVSTNGTNNKVVELIVDEFTFVDKKPVGTQTDPQDGIDDTITNSSEGLPF